MANNNTSDDGTEGDSSSSTSLNEPLLPPPPPSQERQEGHEDEDDEEGDGGGAIIETSVSTITDDDDDDENSDEEDDEENGSFYQTFHDYYEEFTSIRRRRRRRRSSSSDEEGNRCCHHSCSCGKVLRSCTLLIAFFIILLWIISFWFHPQPGSLDRLPTFLFPTFLFPTINGNGGGGGSNDQDHDNIHVADSPTQIHLAYTSDPSVVIVQFTTAVAKHPRITPVAMYGIDEPTTKVDDGSTTTYTASDMCTSPANTSDDSAVVGQLHSIALTNLQPSTYYNYKVGLTFGQGIVWSSLGSFPSPPSLGSTTNYTYVVYGAGTYANLQDLTFGSEVKSIHHLGNLVNASGDNTKWESWMTAVGDKFASQIPIQIVVGNQDYDYSIGKNETTTKDPSGVTHPYNPTWGNYNSTSSGGECGVPLSKRFTMPSGTQQSNGVFWYSYKTASIHTIVLSTEHSLEINSTQQQFLLSSLQQFNRTITPWLIVEMHRSLYYPYNITSTDGSKDYTVGLNLRSQLEQIFVDGEVDLVLSGHAKSYSRSCQNLFEEKCGGPFYNNGTGPTYITVGGSSGSSRTTSGEESSKYFNDDDDDEIYIENNYTEKTIKSPTNGYGRITVNSTNLLFEYVVQQGGADSNNNTVLDEVVITRRR